MEHVAQALTRAQRVGAASRTYIYIYIRVYTRAYIFMRLCVRVRASEGSAFIVPELHTVAAADAAADVVWALYTLCQGKNTRVHTHIHGEKTRGRFFFSHAHAMQERERERVCFIFAPAAQLFGKAAHRTRICRSWSAALFCSLIPRCYRRKSSSTSGEEIIPRLAAML